MKRYRHYTDPPIGAGSSSNSGPVNQQIFASNFSCNWHGWNYPQAKQQRFSGSYGQFGGSWRSMPNITKYYNNCHHSKAEPGKTNQSKLNQKKEKKKKWKLNKSLQKQQRKEEEKRNQEPNDDQNKGNKNEFERKKGKNNLPDRWKNYSVGIGRPLENTRFLPFKCPLGPKFFQNRKDVQPFDVKTITEHVTTLSGRLGLVVDLTATNRYYDSQLWSEYEIKYEKHVCPGHSINTSEHYYRRFAISIKRFLQQNAHNEKLIGVHCTHGLNRTGYLICRFLIEEQGWTAKCAIESFAEARGYPIEREAYIQTLHQIEEQVLANKT